MYSAHNVLETFTQQAESMLDTLEKLVASEPLGFYFIPLTFFIFDYFCFTCFSLSPVNRFLSSSYVHLL